MAMSNDTQRMSAPKMVHSAGVEQRQTRTEGEHEHGLCARSVGRAGEMSDQRREARDGLMMISTRAICETTAPLYKHEATGPGVAVTATSYVDVGDM